MTSAERCRVPFGIVQTVLTASDENGINLDSLITGAVVERHPS
jgi:hypothetical protein